MKKIVFIISECGGNFYNSSGSLVSPSYPDKYPHKLDCIYLVAQQKGTFINLSVITMDINCHETHSTSDHMEIRDGISEDSPLMARLCGNNDAGPKFMQTTQHYLRIR